MTASIEHQEKMKLRRNGCNANLNTILAINMNDLTLLRLIQTSCLATPWDHQPTILHPLAGQPCEHVSSYSSKARDYCRELYYGQMTYTTNAATNSPVCRQACHAPIRIQALYASGLAPTLSAHPPNHHDGLE